MSDVNWLTYEDGACFAEGYVYVSSWTPRDPRALPMVKVGMTKNPTGRIGDLGKKFRCWWGYESAWLSRPHFDERATERALLNWLWAHPVAKIAPQLVGGESFVNITAAEVIAYAETLPLTGHKQYLKKLGRPHLQCECEVRRRKQPA